MGMENSADMFRFGSYVERDKNKKVQLSMFMETIQEIPTFSLSVVLFLNKWFRGIVRNDNGLSRGASSTSFLFQACGKDLPFTNKDISALRTSSLHFNPFCAASWF